MPFSAHDLVYGFAIPALVAGIVLFVMRLLPGASAKRASASVALVGAFLLAYWLLPLGPLAPNRYWCWLPYAMLLTLGVGPASSVKQVSWPERGGLFVTMAIVCAWFLVPTWDNLAPPRHFLVFAWAGYTALLAGLLAPLTPRFAGTLLPIVLTISLACAGLVATLSGSLRYGQMALAGASAMMGMSVASLFMPRADALTGIAATYSVLAAGTMLIGLVNNVHGIPTICYLLVPLAPLALWIGACGPLAKLAGWRRWLVHGSLPLVVLIAGVAIAVAYTVDFSGE